MIAAYPLVRRLFIQHLIPLSLIFRATADRPLDLELRKKKTPPQAAATLIWRRLRPPLKSLLSHKKILEKRIDRHVYSRKTDVGKLEGTYIQYIPENNHECVRLQRSRQTGPSHRYRPFFG